MGKPRNDKRDYKNEARALRSKGLIPNWDLRKPLTAGQKSLITKRVKEWGQVVRRPDDFQFRKVKPDTLKQLKAIGFQTHKGRAIIPTRGQKVNIKRGQVYIHKSGQLERVVLAAGPGLLDRLETLMDREPQLRPGEFWGIKLGGDFWTATGNTFTDSLADLYRQLQHYSARTDLLPYISIVRVRFEDGDDWELNI